MANLFLDFTLKRGIYPGEPNVTARAVSKTTIAAIRSPKKRKFVHIGFTEWTKS